MTAENSDAGDTETAETDTAGSTGVDEDTENDLVSEIPLSRRSTVLTGLGLGALGLLSHGSQRASAAVDAGRYLSRDEDVLNFTGAAEWQNEVTNDSPNSTGGAASVVSGGRNNSANGENSTVGGGRDNNAFTDGATVSGGGSNTADGEGATVGGGGNNAATSDVATIGGGSANVAGALSTTVGGGSINIATGEAATIGGGRDNRTSGIRATVSGGQANAASEPSAAVGGGRFNTASGEEATVGGGRDNTAGSENATVGGGRDNGAFDDGATVGGGRSNAADGEGATVGGGGNNAATGDVATIGGGSANAAGGLSTTVGGGSVNVATGEEATIGGGRDNRAAGERATVPGGRENVAGGDYSFAAGRRATANHDGAFVVGNSNDAEVESGGVDEVRFQAGGGFVIEELPTGRGRNLQWDDGALVRPISSARYKTNIEPLETESGAVLDIEPRSFEYTETGTDDVGLIAEEVAALVPELVFKDEEGRPDGVKYDRLGVYLVPEIRRQRDRIDDHCSRIDELERVNAELHERLAALEEYADLTPVAADGGTPKTDQ